MRARGKREAQRNASPLVANNNFEQSTESAKYQRQLFRSFRASRSLRAVTRGDAPHVVRRLPLAFIFRAFGARILPGGTRLTLFGACPWLSYSAPLALAYYQGGRASESMITTTRAQTHGSLARAAIEACSSRWRLKTGGNCLK